MKDVGRNDKCPCGSGKKYKKCCISKMNLPDKFLRSQITALAARREAEEIQRKTQQGLGRPIISGLYGDRRIIAVGNELHAIDKDKSFHDFLLRYIFDVLGRGWAGAQLKLSENERHPILTWHDKASRYLNNETGISDDRRSRQMTGAISALMNLSYQLFLIKHNVELQNKLIKRLKNIDQFQGALYETYVSSTFIKAGFSINFEDESDGLTSHCEFVATNPISGKSYAVEAKSKEFSNTIKHASFKKTLRNALNKHAEHPRIIFINLNYIPTDKNMLNNWHVTLHDTLEGAESITINNTPAPPAYIFVTNITDRFQLDETTLIHQWYIDGFKIPDFGVNSKFGSIKEYYYAAKKHSDIYLLIDSLSEFSNIPATFTGESPEHAFGKNDVPKLKIGNFYLVQDSAGLERRGLLVDVVVAENNKQAWTIHQLEDGQQIISTCTLTDAEFSAYQQHPETYFGKYTKKHKNTDTPMGLFHFFFDTYKNSDRKTLLSFMKNHPDPKALEQMDNEELAVTYCEGMVNSTLKRRP